MFKPNPKQVELIDLISKHPNVMAFGGARSGKSMALCAYIFYRAMNFPNSRQAIVRATLKACRETMFQLTFKDTVKLCSPELYALWGSDNRYIKVNKTDMTIEFENGSIIMFLGLDDDHRLENVLGQEFLTIYLNECSQMHSYNLVSTLRTRLSQTVMSDRGDIATPKFLFDCNPPAKSHWTYRAFVEKINPIDRTPWADPDRWAYLQINAWDNQANLPKGYIDTLSADLNSRQRRRLIDGEFTTDVENALFKPEWIDEGRLDPKDFDLSKMRRVVVAVDPAVTGNASSDETGIIVTGIDEDEQIYVIADRSMRGTPDAWAKAVGAAYEEFQADVVIAEVNNGGDLIKTQLRLANSFMKIETVHAKRGKVLRADPVSTLYEQGRVSHVGEFRQLEEQMETFTTDYNPAKQGSPDRLDACVYAVTALGVKNSRPSTIAMTPVGGF